MTTNSLIRSMHEELELHENLSLLHQEGMFTGTTGLAYYYYHLFLITKQKSHLLKSKAYVEQVIDTIGEEQQIITYYASNFAFGMSGFAFLLNSFGNEMELSYGIKSIKNDLDEMIYQSMLNQINHKQYNLLYGFSGSLYYINSRTDAKAVKEIDHFLNHLILESRFADYNSVPAYLDQVFDHCGNSSNYGLIDGITGVFYVLLLIAIKHPTIAQKFLLKNIVYDFLITLTDKQIGHVRKNFIFETEVEVSQQSVYTHEQLSSHINDLYITLFLVRYQSHFADHRLDLIVSKKLLDVIDDNKFIQPLLFRCNMLPEITTAAEVLKAINKYVDYPEINSLYHSICESINKCLLSNSHRPQPWNQKLSLIKGYPIIILNQLSFKQADHLSAWNKVLFL